MCMGLKLEKSMTNKNNITKKELISIIENNKNKASSEIGKFLAIYKDNKSFWYDHDYNKFDCEDEYFKLVHSVGSWRKYYYCISNYGRVIVLNTNQQKEFKLSKELTYYLIQITEKGYMTNVDSKLPEGVNVAKEKEVYELMRDSGWLKDDKKFAEKLLENRKNEIKNNRLEIHHINNKPNDNRIENLIYIPKSIHNYAH